MEPWQYTVYSSLRWWMAFCCITQPDIREIQVMDKFGKVVKQFKYSSGNKRATINMSELRTDVYFIKVFNGKEWKGQSVIKQ